MKYSIIIPYRNRENHLAKILPRLHDIFQKNDYEIIIVEQDDDDKFQKNSLYNIAAKRANGELLIFHDVDYYPASDVSYDTDEYTPLYPVGKVKFLDVNDVERKYEDIPAGYRNFHFNVGDHSGGVFVLHKNLFEKVNGLNPYYRGWGKEDDDTRERLRINGYEWKRNDGLFYALYHEDSKPSDDDVDFINNHRLLYSIRDNISIGYDDLSADCVEFDAGNNVRWLKVNNFVYSNIDLL
jgi:glycosyltransferase involved in cell wall biosynthesis